MSRRVLLISHEPIGPNMAGPAVRYWEFSQTLSQMFEVTLAIPPHHEPQTLPRPVDFGIHWCKNSRALKQLIRQSDVVITVGANLSIYPFLRQIKQPLVVDMYIPSILEGLQKYQPHPLAARLNHYRQFWQIHYDQIQAADFIICASEKQRDYWLGWLTALGRVNPYTHQADASLRQLIEVVPFGLPDGPPQTTQAVLKGVHPMIGRQDKLILWGGGLWDWLDWRIALEAVALLRQQQAGVKLFFMGVKRPHNQYSKMDAVAQAEAYSQALGLWGSHVIFNDWVPYQQRHHYLLEADIGLSLHRNHIETRFAFRTRLLDYMWCGLPIVATEGDVLSDEVTRWQIGQTIRSGDVQQLVSVLRDLLQSPNLRQQYRPQFEQVRQRYQWSQVMQPLIEFCQAPRHAADYQQKNVLPQQNMNRSLPHKIWSAFKQGGVSEIVRQTRQYARWRWQ